MERVVKYQDFEVDMIIMDPDEHIQKHWMQHRFYEAQRNGLLNWVFKHMLHVKTIIDVGASIGNHAIFFKHICKAERVIAIEPYGPSFEHLQQNIEMNGGGIEAFNYALGAGSGLVEMQLNDGGTNNVGMVQVAPGYSLDAYNAFEKPVEMLDLDSLVMANEWPVIDYIKIDVEHYTIPVIIGMEQTLEIFRPTLSIECETEKQLAQAAGWLKRHDYNIIEGLTLNHTPTYIFDHETKWNL